MTDMHSSTPSAGRSRPPERPRFLSEADCHEITQRLARFSKGGGYTTATIVSTWRGNVRWARNLVSTSGEVRDDHILVNRNINGAFNNWEEVNDASDATLMGAVRRAERVAKLRHEVLGSNMVEQYQPEPFASPQLFFDATYQLAAPERAAAARALAQTAADAGLMSAGYIEVSAHSQALITSYGYARYFQYTSARYSVTVRDPKGVGSGWAGVDWADWNKVDGAKLTQIAMEKCLHSRNPVAIEPARYTTILEPQATCDFVGPLMNSGWWDFIPYQAWDRHYSETTSFMPFFWRADLNGKKLGYSKIGQRIVDERISITADPMDPGLGFPPFRGVEDLESVGSVWGDVYHPVTWIKDGILTNLAYDRHYAMETLRQNTGLPNQGAFRMSGGDTSIADMIATTKRGVLVTRFDRVRTMGASTSAAYGQSLMVRGYTRDGFWLIENGKISKAIKNMVFTESILSVLNSVDQLGVPQRAFHPPDSPWWWMDQPQPVIVPPMKVRDFSFTALTNAI